METCNPTPAVPFGPYAGDMDEQTAAVILQLQLEDIESIATTAKGKGRASDTLNDQEYALRLYQQELEVSTTTLNDRIMGQSITRAAQTDHHILTHEVEIEEAAARDRRLAYEIDGRPAPLAIAPCGSEGVKDGEAPLSAAADEEFLAKLAALYISETEGVNMLAAVAVTSSDCHATNDGAPIAESSTSGATKGKGRASTILDRRCEVCREEKKFFDVATMPDCRHDYCRDCLDQLFHLSMTDETLYPPRCCRQPISLQAVRIFLTADTAREFERRRPELETPNRTYCFRPTCSAWIPPQDIADDVGTCPACSARTCAICKAEAHVGQDCPEDEAMQMLLRTADESGWQRCYQCRRIVELDIGCYHMSCRCGGQFCYVCGERWKTCRCPQWDEGRLYHRAAQIQRRRPLLELAAVAPVAAAPAPAQQAIEGNAQDPTVDAPTLVSTIFGPLPANPATQNLEAMAQHLRDNHECEHEEWTYVRGQNECEECGDTLRQYIYECSQCFTMMCNRCRRNRA